MQRTLITTNGFIVSLCSIFLVGCLGLDVACGTTTDQSSVLEKSLILLLPQNPLGKLQRPQVVFNHDLHTSTLREYGQTECTSCHVTEESTSSGKVAVFRFPKTAVDPANKTAFMKANHNECVSCHRKLRAEGRKSGPDIGMCGKCHVKTSPFQTTQWAWQPIFNYVTHGKHVTNMQTNKIGPEFSIVSGLSVDPASVAEGKRCELCHHVVDEKTKKLVYKKDCENACGACHKAQDEKNVRSLKKSRPCRVHYVPYEDPRSDQENGRYPFPT